MKICRVLLAAMVAISGLACGDDDEEPQVEPTPMEPATGREATLRLMAEHYLKATETREALISDDIESARTAMSWLAENETNQDELPEEAAPHLAHMREKAAAFADATTLTEAGVSFGQMLSHCGDCHSVVEGGPTFEAPPVPAGEDLPTRMHRHRWSAERMWEGLVSRDEELYNSGAGVLESVTLYPEELPAGVMEPERLQAIADLVHELGDQAGEAEDWPARGEIYGRFVATCATCHRAMGVGAVARAAMEAASAMEE